MKKIFFLTGVAMCALTLATSCVKDNESASVTSLRNAKTEQIKAAAELAKAQAAAATLAAQADANLKSAQAEYQKAYAEYEKAKVEMAQLENALFEAKMDAEKAEIAKRIAEAQAAEALAQQQLQSTLNQIETDKLNFEYEMSKLVAKLERKKADDAMNELNWAAFKYQFAVSALANALEDLNESKVELTLAELDQVVWEEQKVKDIATYKQSIAQNQAKIEVYKKYVNYTEDLQALQNKYSALDSELSKLCDEINAAEAVLEKEVKDTAEKAAADKLKENPFWQLFYNNGFEPGDVTPTPVSDDVKDKFSVTLSDGETRVYIYDTKAWWLNPRAVSDNIEKVIATYDNDKLFVTIGTFVSKAIVYDNNDGLSGTIEEVGVDRINVRIKEDKTAYTGELKIENEKLNDLKSELKDLRDDETKKLNNLKGLGVYDARYAEAKNAYEAALAKANDKQAEVDAQNGKVKTLANQSEAYDIVADFVANYADNCKAVDALYNDVLEAKASDWAEYAESWLAFRKLREEYLMMITEFNAVSAVLYGGDVNGAEFIDEQIKNLEDDIKGNQDLIDNYDLYMTNPEQAIEALKKYIALQEELIKSLEITANQRKAEYEAVLAKYQNAE